MCDDAVVIEDRLAAVRKRPGMYVGDPRDGTGAEELLFEMVANALDRFLAGELRHLAITLRPGELEVLDDGPGIAIERTSSGRSFLEQVLTTFHDAPTADGHAPHVHLAGAGPGLALVCALCSEVVVSTRGVEQRFGRGKALSLAVPSAIATGVRFRAVLDPDIFPSQGWRVGPIAERLRVIAAHAPGLAISLRHEGMFGVEEQLFGPFVGPAALLDMSGCSLGGRVFVAHARDGATYGDVALRFRPRVGAVRGPARIDSFCNFKRTTGRGTHVDAFRGGLLRALDVARFSERKWIAISDLDAVVSVRCVDPTYFGPTRDMLASPEVAPFFTRFTEEQLREQLAETPEVRDELLVRLQGG